MRYEVIFVTEVGLFVLCQHQLLRVHRWSCTVHPFSDSHWASVVRGPPDAVIDAWGVRHAFNRTMPGR